MGLLWFGVPSSLAIIAAAEDRSSESVDFVRDVRPIFRKHCHSCHGPELQEGGLRLDRKGARLGEGAQRVIVPGKPDDSRLLTLISGAGDGRLMPPPDGGSALDAAQISLIRRWIESGARWPQTLEDGRGAQELGPLWSLQPLRRPSLPAVRDAGWGRNPIDLFILDGLQRAGLQPAERASPESLLRRAALDLVGLPPEPSDTKQILGPRGGLAPAAYERFVDRLLASPHYGERWARHWLDLVRYADSNGYEVDGPKPLAWKYRDYVIRSWNVDKAFDRFAMEQLAGDELADASPETVIATGFYRVGPWDAERGASVQPSEVVAERYNELDDMVSTTAQAFLGMTLGCARCHDHKFDPLTARDYYAMVAIFNPLQRHRSGRSELSMPAVPPRDLPAKRRSDERIAELRRRFEALSEPLRRGMLESGRSELPPDAVEALLEAPARRTPAQKKLVDEYRGRWEQTVRRSLADRSLVSRYLPNDALRMVNEARHRLDHALRDRIVYPEGYFFYEKNPSVETRLLKRGNPNQPGETVAPNAPAAIVRQGGMPPMQLMASDGFTTRRRLSLAKWIVDPRNPLTARVIVNRVWQHHFGEGLVRTPSDFGRRGSRPTHPELLDWLADWFMREGDWSLKRLHRLIMTSGTYQMSKRSVAEHARLDPDNRWWWRFPYRRLEAEVIRDAMLAASGQLNRSLYGPAMHPFIPSDARRSGYDPQGVWPKFQERDASRRTIYAYVKRTLIVPFLDTLDFCDTTRSAERREVTTVAPQALELFNGEFVNRQARHFADRLRREAGPNVDAQLRLAFRLALSRDIHPDELVAFRRFWRDERTQRLEEEGPERAERGALSQAARVIFNMSEFVYPD